MQYKIEYKNLFTTFQDLIKITYHINHYISNMNKAQTGVYYCHNLELLLLNISHFKQTIKYSTKKAENVLYFPFTGKCSFNLLKIKTNFKDIVNNQAIEQLFEEKNVENLFQLINKNINKLNTDKQAKDNILTCLENIEKYLWVMYTCWKIYIDEYERSFNKK